MIKKSLTLQVQHETIAYSIISQDEKMRPPRFVFLHGAGTGIKERVISIAEPIINTGINILTLDFSGHGESTGELKKSSLQKRVNEAITVIDHVATKEPLIVCGVSMGGFIAIKLLERYKIETLILFCPAIYDSKAYTVPFDEGFTEIIRAYESWRNTDILDSLTGYTGKLLVVMGESDTVIPSGVIDLIMHHTPNVSKKELYLIPHCPHRISGWLLDHPQEQLKLHQKIAAFTHQNAP